MTSVLQAGDGGNNYLTYKGDPLIVSLLKIKESMGRVILGGEFL
jgi:hypothetical protein